MGEGGGTFPRDGGALSTGWFLTILTTQVSALHSGFRRTGRTHLLSLDPPTFPQGPPHLGAQLHLTAEQLHQGLVAAGGQHHLVPQPHLQLQGAQVAPGTGSL